MNEGILWTILIFSIANTGLIFLVWLRASKASENASKEVREELRQSREEARAGGKELREEVTGNLKSTGELLSKNFESMGMLQLSQLEGMTKQLKELSESNQNALDRIRNTFDALVKGLQDANEKKLEDMRKEISEGLKATNELLSKTLDGMSVGQKAHLEGMTRQLKELTDSNQGALDQIRATFDRHIKDLQDSNEKRLGEMRKEVSEGLKTTNELLSKTLESMGANQKSQLEDMTKHLKDLTETNQGALERVRTTFDTRVKELQENNEKKLDEMRRTVDEKLHETLEKRLGESFKQVSERLEAVHKGLGEMQSLATGVGDLKRVLTNVKSRGNWAEFQLGAILEQILTPDQWSKNVIIKKETSERVEYAIRLPGPKDNPEEWLWLPIDSKFPKEDYSRLQEAAEKGDSSAVQAAVDSLVRTIRSAAKEVSEKYVNPPVTTDFGIMFLATEGLYAEVLRQPGFVEELLRKFRVVVAGPTTLAAILSSLRMGFQTLAIEKRTSEVWKILGAIKTDFGKFGDILDKVKKQLVTASNTIELTGARTRAIERKLRSVEQLPEHEVAGILELNTAVIEVVPDENEQAPDAEEKDPLF